MPPDAGGRDDVPRKGWLGRQTLAPVLAGVLLDAIDFATMGPIGLSGGFLVAGGAGYWIAVELGLQRRSRIGLALMAAAYAATPFTELLPLGTLVGLLTRFTRIGQRPSVGRGGATAANGEPDDLHTSE